MSRVAPVAAVAVLAIIWAIALYAAGFHDGQRDVLEVLCQAHGEHLTSAPDPACR